MPLDLVTPAPHSPTDSFDHDEESESDWGSDSESESESESVSDVVRLGHPSDRLLSGEIPSRASSPSISERIFPRERSQPRLIRPRASRETHSDRNSPVLSRVSSANSYASYTNSTDSRTQRRRERQNRYRADSRSPIRSGSSSGRERDIGRWVADAQKLAVNATISQDKTGGKEQDDQKIFAALAQKLATAALPEASGPLPSPPTYEETLERIRERQERQELPEPRYRREPEPRYIRGARVERRETSVGSDVDLSRYRPGSLPEVPNPADRVTVIEEHSPIRRPDPRSFRVTYDYGHRNLPSPPPPLPRLHRSETVDTDNPYRSPSPRGSDPGAARTRRENSIPSPPRLYPERRYEVEIDSLVAKKRAAKERKRLRSEPSFSYFSDPETAAPRRKDGIPATLRPEMIRRRMAGLSHPLAPYGEDSYDEFQEMEDSSPESSVHHELFQHEDDDGEPAFSANQRAPAPEPEDLEGEQDGSSREKALLSLLASRLRASPGLIRQLGLDVGSDKHEVHDAETPQRGRARKVTSHSNGKVAFAADETDEPSRDAASQQTGPTGADMMDAPTPPRQFKDHKSRHAKAKSKAKPADSPMSSPLDYKHELCRILGLDPDASDARLLEAMQHSQKPARTEIHFTVLHRLRCEQDKGGPTVFEAEPYYLNPNTEENHLRGREQVFNMELYEERHKGLSFVVYKHYTCCQAVKRAPTSGSPMPSGESLSIRNEDLIVALRKVAKKSSKSFLYPNFKVGPELQAPYIWFYHDRPHLEKAVSELKSKYRKHLACLFQGYIDKHMEEEYNEVTGQLKDKMISSKYLSYIFLPNEVLLQKDKEKDQASDRAHLQLAWPRKTETWQAVAKKADEEQKKEGQQLSVNLILQGSSWDYDGSFAKSQSTLNVELTSAAGKCSRIADLAVFPLRYADEGTRERLLQRGTKFWDCRNMKYVSYTGWDYNRLEKFREVRFMIDTNTYKKMHPDAQKGRRLRDEIGAEAMAKDTAPSEEFVLMLPPNLLGFNMQEKKWMNLYVDNMSDVDWNKDAFETLVVDDETKELIKALVTNKIEATKSTDLMSGKGNGLIMLLHGGPGTGKTLTAESVAEYAKKPLYRATAGDLGVRPEDVEKYLTSVLYLGKMWDCVVLLDEAEVFLQTRDLEDLQRNALVSVFLRVLEYYEGILLLTSNRVATFDEAFKSRIQLALHYGTLKADQRKQIWANFVDRLETFKTAESASDRRDGPIASNATIESAVPTKTDETNIEDLRKNLNKLAQYDMNGRQIRNAVTTARQLSMFKGKAMDFSILQHVITVSSRFDTYLKEVNENRTDEELARDGGVR